MTVHGNVHGAVLRGRNSINSPGYQAQVGKGVNCVAIRVSGSHLLIDEVHAHGNVLHRRCG